MGANNGEFSKLASGRSILTIAFDIDPIAVEEAYLYVKKTEDKKLLPLIMDFSNPSAPSGWGNEERKSFCQRGPADCIFALALIHHLSITNNLPFDMSAKFFSQLGSYLVIEFIPKEDSKVKMLLSSRKDVFSVYNIRFFEKEYSRYFTIIKKEEIKGSDRVLYLMKKNE